MKERRKKNSRQNKCMHEVGTDLWRSPSPTMCSEQVGHQGQSNQEKVRWRRPWVPLPSLCLVSPGPLPHSAVGPHFPYSPFCCWSVPIENFLIALHVPCQVQIWVSLLTPSLHTQCLRIPPMSPVPVFSSCMLHFHTWVLWISPFSSMQGSCYSCLTSSHWLDHSWAWGRSLKSNHLSWTLFLFWIVSYGILPSRSQEKTVTGLTYAWCSFSSFVLLKEIQVQSPESFATLRTDRMMPTHIKLYKLFLGECIKMENLILHTR